MSWMADLEYRLNISIRFFGEFMWYSAQLSVFEVLYLHAPAISGWDVHAMRVFMGTLVMGDVFYMIFFQENMDNFSQLVRNGDLDMYLVKPINSQFMVSCRKIATAYLLNLSLIAGYLIWAISKLQHPLSPAQIMGFGFALACGLLTLYALRFLFMTLVLFLQNGSNIHFIWYNLYRLATRPDRILPPYLRLAVLTLFPIAFFASVPSRVLIEGLDPWLLLAAPAVALGSLYLSHLAWNRALRMYSSASS
jgi:ABC-2 type transport system permease protein